MKARQLDPLPNDPSPYCFCCDWPTVRPESDHPWDCTCHDAEVCIACWRCYCHCQCEEPVNFGDTIRRLFDKLFPGMTEGE